MWEGGEVEFGPFLFFHSPVVLCFILPLPPLYIIFIYNFLYKKNKKYKKYRVKDIKIYSYCLGWENLCEHECVDAITTLLPIVVAVCVGVTKLARAKGAKEAQRVEQKEMR